MTWLFAACALAVGIAHARLLARSKPGMHGVLGWFARYFAVEREPVSGTYRGYTIYSSAPPVSGGATLVAQLNQLIELKPGTPARASDVNANFRLLADLVEDAAASLEASIANQVGPVGQPLTIARTQVTR